MDDLRLLSPVQWHHRRHAALKKERQSWWEHWRDIQEHFLPRTGRWLESDVNKGGKRNDKIIDATGKHSLNILKSGLMSGITSPARKWFRLIPPDPEMRAFGPVQEWLDKVERLMFDVFRQSNLYRVLPSVYEDLAGFGTAPFFQLRDPVSVARFGSFQIGEYCIAQDSEGAVRTVYRDLPMTVQQVVDRYGDTRVGPNKRWNNFSDHVRNLYERGQYDAWVNTVHVVSENPDWVPGSELAREMRYMQLVYEQSRSGDDSVPNGEPLHRGGFKRFPIHVPRWDVRYPDVYGRSPAMDALGDVRQLQEQQKRKAQAIAKLVNPPMLASPSMKEERMSTLPGDVTYVDLTTGADGFRPAYQVSPQLQDMVLDIEDTRARIRRHMFSDLFLAITDRPGVQPLNDSEVFERKEEKLLALGPVLESVDDDMLDPLINNTFADLVELGRTPPPPRELAGAPLTVEYQNIIALAQRAQGLLGLQDTAAFVAGLAAGEANAGREVTAYDSFDIDEAIREYGEKRGVPAGVIRDEDEILAIRQQRAAAIARAQQLQDAKTASEAERNLADVESTRQGLSGEGLGSGALVPPGVQRLQ